MAVGPGTLPTFFPVAGVRLGIGSAGIKKPGKKDLVVIELAPGSRVAGIFTRNQFCAAPVHVTRSHLGSDAPRYLLINTGNANAGTGEQGMKDARACCQALADHAGVSAGSVLPFSTGVIGEPLPVEKIVSALPQALADVSESHWAEAASGIMTTDTRPKGASRQIDLDGQTVSISGISKGAGMIRPNMATMLGFHRRQFEELLAMATAQSRFSGDSHFASEQTNENRLSEAYKLLGVDTTCSDAELKKAYRKLVSQHHPDKLVSKGLPEEMMRIATEKTREIKEAYELIKQTRSK